MATTMAWKVYGTNGHRQAESFNESKVWDFSNQHDGTRILDIRNSDITGTNDYTLLLITRDTAVDCMRELSGQISDGLFENCRVGDIVAVPDHLINSLNHAAENDTMR